MMYLDVNGNMTTPKYSDGERDKFYTSKENALRVLKHINLEKFDMVIEPSAGDGSFSNQIDHNNVVALDIYPEAPGIIKKNWFEYKVPKKYKNILVVGNPPFGKRNKIAIDFITHATKYNNIQVIAFILPNAFKKYTLQTRIDSSFKLKKVVKLHSNEFFVNSEGKNIPCSFFIFDRKAKKDLRQDKNKRSNDFRFVTKNEDFDFFTFGSAPHNTIKWSERHKINRNNRGYYIKSNIGIKKLDFIWANVNWEGHSSVNGGVYWMTQVDIVENYERAKRRNNE